MNEWRLAPDSRRRAWLGALLAFAAWPVRAPAQAAPLPVPPGVLLRPWPRRRATPALDLPALDGTRWHLAGSRGRVVLANFWASWCEPCVAELPSLHALAERHADQGLHVVAVNHREGPAAIERFLARTPIGPPALPVLLDADGAAAHAFGVRIFPATVAFARDGRAAFSAVGEVDWTGAEARQWIASLL